MTETKPLSRIVIVGGGSAGWMSAATLVNALGRSVQIDLIESEAIGTVGVGEATIPPIREFNRRLGIDEATFIRETQGSYKLGIEFADWTREGERYFHPFGYFGADFDPHVPFHHYWLARHIKGAESNDLQDYSMAWSLASEGRFGHPANDARSMLSRFDYAYHFDATLYAAYLRRLSEARGVKRLEGRVTDVGVSAETGDISHITLEDGRNLEADLFIDCTGFRGVLIEGAMETGYEDWRKWLPCDRAVAIPSKSGPDPWSYTRATAKQAGWQWRIPLQHRVGNGYVYCSDHLDAETAERSLREDLDDVALADAKHLRFITGRRRLFWNRNCVSIGLSAGFMEPLESTSLHLIQTGIMRLVTLLPDGRDRPHLREEYNRLTIAEYERVRDFLILHYIANARDEPFWKRMRHLTLPETLQFKIDHFRENGIISLDGRELFGKPSWLAVLVGQNILPERLPGLSAHAEARGVPTAERFSQIRSAIDDARKAVPMHGEFIRSLER